jgi:hypothetical protein
MAAMAKSHRTRTRTAIFRLRGILNRKPGSRPFAEEWSQHKAEERKLEPRRGR